VSIPLLAQAVMAMGLSRPDNSRARPSSLLKRDDDYQKIFSANLPLEVFLWLAQSQKAVDAFLLSEGAGVTAQERTNLRFHLAMVAAARLTGSKVRNPSQLRAIAQASQAITDADLAACLEVVRQKFAERERVTGDAADKIAKGLDFVDFLLDRALPPTDAIE